MVVTLKFSVLSMETSLDSPIAIKVKKEARLEARVTIEQKRLMERAAFLRGQNLTEFMVAVLSETAIQTIKERELLELTARDRQVFANALLNPPIPSDRAISDAQWYAQLMNGKC